MDVTAARPVMGIQYYRYKVRILPCCPAAAAAAAGDDRKNTFKRNRSRPLYL